MKKTGKRIIVSAAMVCAALALILACALFAVQTKWFKEKVRQKIIEQAEQVSGGRVELGSFTYDWRTLSAEFRHFVVHGSEPTPAPPLFEADRVVVGLKVISIFKRNIDVQSVLVQRPRVHILVAADGSTNIPSPRFGKVRLAAGVQALLELKVRHFEVDDGLIEVGLHSIPLNVKGEDTFLILLYAKNGQRYDATFSSHDLHVYSDLFRPFAGTLNAKAWLKRDSVSLRSATFKSRGSTVQASGNLREFAHPVADFKVLAEVEASDVAAITKIEDIGRGRFTLNGAAHYSEQTALEFRGKLSGHDFDYRIKSLDFKRLNFDSEIVARQQDVALNHLTATAIGARFSGDASLRRGHDLRLDGRLSSLQSDAVARLLLKRALPWSAAAAGPIHLRARWQGGWHDLAVQSDLSISPTPGVVPVSGNIDAEYRSNGQGFEFGPSILNSASTRLSFSGVFGASADIVLDSTDLEDLKLLTQYLGLGSGQPTLPVLLRDGAAHFAGRLSGPLDNPQVIGDLALSRFQIQNQSWSGLRLHLAANQSGLDFSSLELDRGLLHAAADGHVGLDHWSATVNAPVQAKGQFRGVDLLQLTNSFTTARSRLVRGIASGTFDIRGSAMSPQGDAQLEIDDLDVFSEHLVKLKLNAMFAGGTTRITNGQLRAGPAEVSFSGTYKHALTTWMDGRLDLKIDSNGFPIASLAPVRESLPGLNAQFEVHGQGAVQMQSNGLQLLGADGTAVLRNLTVNKVLYGSLNLSAGTRGERIISSFTGDLQGSHLSGSAQVQLTAGNPAVGELHLDQIQLSTIVALIQPQRTKLPFDGLLQGGLTFEGPLEEPGKMHGTISVESLQFIAAGESLGPVINPADLTFHNAGPVVLQYSNGVASISRFEMKGRGSDVTISGSVPLLPKKPMQLKVNGAMDLGLFGVFDPNVRASGQSVVAASIGGTPGDLAINGTVEMKNGTFFDSSLPNGLTAVNGLVRFDRDRATIEKLTAQTGGGQLSVGGFMSFGHGGPLIYRLEANAENVRFRYGGSVSMTATSQLRLTGSSKNSILSGTATISRVIFTPNTDVGNLLASVAAPTASPSDEKDFLTGLQFDILVDSAPNLQLSTELSRDVEAEIDLRLRGTPERPILLGNINANQGDIRVFGTKYTINRGEVNFVNAVKIEPVLDLDLQTQARGITVDITVSGTPGKLNINYRSDPPLQPRDIIALLTVGRTPNTVSNVPNISTTNDVSALQSGANTVLGQVISPASNRLSKLFGITNIKIDPMVQGITNTPQARLTVEQQISRQITVTYVTNLSQTSEQIFRLEWAFSTQYSLVALRDDNGEFGIDIQYRKRFK